MNNDEKAKLNKSEGIKYFFPYWGPFVFVSKIEDEFVDLLLKRGKQSKEKRLSATSVLAGQIKNEYNYENFEFRSPINTWNIQKEYSENYGKSKVMELTLKKNDVIYIPSYWCYSIQFGDNAMVLNLGYSTMMSFVSTIHHQCLYFLQQQNIKHKTAKCISNIEIEKMCEDKEEKKEEDKNVKLKEKES